MRLESVVWFGHFWDWIRDFVEIMIYSAKKFMAGSRYGHSQRNDKWNFRLQQNNQRNTFNRNLRDSWFDACSSGAGHWRSFHPRKTSRKSISQHPKGDKNKFTTDYQTRLTWNKLICDEFQMGWRQEDDSRNLERNSKQRSFVTSMPCQGYVTHDETHSSMTVAEWNFHSIRKWLVWECCFRV